MKEFADLHCAFAQVKHVLSIRETDDIVETTQRETDSTQGYQDCNPHIDLLIPWLVLEVYLLSETPRYHKDQVHILHHLEYSIHRCYSIVIGTNFSYRLKRQAIHSQ